MKVSFIRNFYKSPIIWLSHLEQNLFSVLLFVLGNANLTKKQSVYLIAKYSILSTYVKYSSTILSILSFNIYDTV